MLPFVLLKTVNFLAAMDGGYLIQKDGETMSYNGLQIGDVAGLEALNCQTTTKVL